MWLVFMKWLSKNLDDLLSFIEISARNEINHNGIGSDDGFSERLRLSLRVENLDLLVGRWYHSCVFLDHGSGELVALFAGLEGLMIVSHALKESVSDQRVDSRQEDSLAILGFDKRNARLGKLGRLAVKLGGNLHFSSIRLSIERLVYSNSRCALHF